MSSKDKNLPLISVVMPNYNNKKFIIETIESVLNQTYSNFEFIILDDCSTDDSWKIIQKYAKKDKRIKAFRNEKNLQIVKSRNKLFSLMSKKSKYVAIIDSDDVAIKNRFELQVNFLEKHLDFGLVGGNLIIIDEESKITGRRKYLSKDSELRKNMLVKNNFAQPTIMMRRTILDKVGNYSKAGKIDKARDYDLWVRFARISKVANLKEETLKYRISSNQVKNKYFKESLKSTLVIQKQYLREFFSFKVLIMMIFESIALVIPKSVTMYMFKKLNDVKN